MAELLGADGLPIEHSGQIDHVFQWASLGTTRKEILLDQLSVAIQDQIKEAIKERIQTSFEADRFRKMGMKDVFMIQMVLRVPVSLMMKIIDEFNASIRKEDGTYPEVPT